MTANEPTPGAGQQAAVIAHMQRNAGLTGFEAIPLGITRLSARIYELRKRGFRIDTERVWQPAPDGALRYVTRYSLRPDTQLSLPL
jgi:hypothetical protein